ncbi:MAG: alcohol dehydrogenase catalytic domain-containing protein [Xanthomonadales bacterium]|nr:alcohol dehydrogenase catalytic domain-containing protein [Xanthomonadales bacterium]
MLAMRLHQIGPLAENPDPLRLESMAVPRPGTGEVLLRVDACGVCHTELDEIEGRTPPRALPLTPGHQATGEVVALGQGCDKSMLGKAVGVAWIFSSCGQCEFCTDGRENLCAAFIATGRDRDGGYAQYMIAKKAFTIDIPPLLDPVTAAPLLCAGAVGFRALEMSGLVEDGALGLTGFGASAHLVLQMALARFSRLKIAVFARNPLERDFAVSLGARWAGDTSAKPPFMLDAIIDTTPAWLPVTAALKRLKPGGKLVINAIRKEEEDKSSLLELDYATQLWMEKSVQSVANVTRKDVRNCLSLAAQARIKPLVTEYSLADANKALARMRRGGTKGAHVLRIA